MKQAAAIIGLGFVGRAHLESLRRIGIPVRGMAHITGGGIVGNLPRCFPKGTAAVVDTKSWTRPAIFDWLQTEGAVA